MSVSPPIHNLNPNPQYDCMGVRGGGFEGSLNLDKGIRMEAPSGDHCPSEELSPRTESVGSLILDFPTSKPGETMSVV